MLDHQAAIIKGFELKPARDRELAPLVRALVERAGPVSGLEQFALEPLDEGLKHALASAMRTPRLAALRPTRRVVRAAASASPSSGMREHANLSKKRI